MNVSNPDKVMFPERGLTKADLVGYYQKVAERMAPMLYRRPLTLHRFPNGVAAKGFMQKNAAKHFPDSIIRYEVPKQGGGVTTYPVITATEDIAWLANQGSIAFHIWLSTVGGSSDSGADWLVLDLDPPDFDADADDDAHGRGRRPVMDVAEVARQVLADFGLQAVPAVTGSKGVHLWVSVEAEAPGRLAEANRALAGLVAVRAPELATTEFLKRDRGRKVFVDWLRANPGATVVAPLSVRATARGSVAVPVDWAELTDVSPDQWTLTDAEELVERPTLLERLDWPHQAVPVDDIVAQARKAGVDLDTPFDRFGRRRTS